jgi:transcriptional regulator with XRE-family HTH domain
LESEAAQNTGELGNDGTNALENGENALENGETENQAGATGGRVIECLLRIGGVDFVLVPAARRASGLDWDASPSRAVNATTNATTRRLWEARRQAGLTQAQLAKRLGRSQATVSQAESGRSRVSERYVNKVLEACQLEAGWGLPKASSEDASGWDLDPNDVAGLDPETLVPVRRGSERDLALRRTLVWWPGFEDET